MALRKVGLELARTPDFPEGRQNRGYEFIAPLSEEDHIDVVASPEGKKRCTVRRFWEGEDDQDGELHHTRHRTWAFSYAPGEDDDTPFFRPDTHIFTVGEYVSITEENGEMLPFRVAGIDAV
jgi:hypothetical protein